MIIIILGFSLFAAAITANKFLLIFLSPAFFVAMRMICAGLLLFLIAVWRSKRLRFGYVKKDILTILLIALCTTFIPSFLKAYGLQYMVSSKSALIGALDPFVTAVYAYFLWSEKLTITKMIGMVVGFSGIVILLVTTSPLEEIAGSWGIISLPELTAFISMVVSRYGWIMARKLLRKNRYKPGELNAMLMMIGGTYSLILAFFLTIPFTFVTPLPSKFYWMFTFSVIVGNMIGYTIYTNFLKKYNLTLISLCGLSVPLFVHLYGPIILGEKLSLTFFISLVIVFTGMLIFQWDHIKNGKKLSLVSTK